MLTRRIIPCLDVKDGRVVKGVNFVELRDAGDPVEAAEAYDAQGADELCFLDISASHEDRGTLLEMVSRVADRVRLPFSVGGGVRSVEDVLALLGAGADKVCINTAAVRRPELVAECADKVGSQAIVVAIDARKVDPDQAPVGELDRPGWLDDHPELALDGAGFEIHTHGGRRPTGIDAVAWARHIAALGAGELLVTSMDRDGTRAGFDLPLTRAIADAVGIPVIASGGVGNLEHLAEGLDQGGADAVLAASIFHFGDYTVAEARRHLLARGLEVRPPRPPLGFEAILDAVKFDADGLVPAVAQDADTGEVLMVAWADRDALTWTLCTGLATWFSRSRQARWLKGATSGHVQDVVEVRLDCDGDTVLYRVRPAGPACHEGTRTCFSRKAEGPAWVRDGAGTTNQGETA